jgi:hypothetical protein
LMAITFAVELPGSASKSLPTSWKMASSNV